MTESSRLCKCDVRACRPVCPVCSGGYHAKSDGGRYLAASTGVAQYKAIYSAKLINELGADRAVMRIAWNILRDLGPDPGWEDRRCRRLRYSLPSRQIARDILREIQRTGPFVGHVDADNTLEIGWDVEADSELDSEPPSSAPSAFAKDGGGK